MSRSQSRHSKRPSPCLRQAAARIMGLGASLLATGSLLGNTSCPREGEDNPGTGDSDPEILVPEGDYGDAPDGYPTRYTETDDEPSYLGFFPSAYGSANGRLGQPGGHAKDASVAWLGERVTVERGVLDENDPDLTHNMTDDDRGDDGVIRLAMPSWHSVLLEVAVTASESAPEETWYVNALLDADGNGRWEATELYPEWRVQNMEVVLVPGETTALTLADFWPIPSRHEGWLRLALSDSPIDPEVYGELGWDGSGVIDRGEVEDMLVQRPVLAWDYDEDWSLSDEFQHVQAGAQSAVAVLQALSSSASVQVAELSAAAAGVASGSASAASAAASAEASAFAAAEAQAEAESFSAAAASSAALASAEAASFSSASASSGCASADAAAYASASASALAAAHASATALAAATAAASASAEASAQASASASAAAAAAAGAESFAVAFAGAGAAADAFAAALALAQAEALAVAEAEALAAAAAESWAQAMALGHWADADVDAWAATLAAARADVDARAAAAALAVTQVLTQVQVLAVTFSQAQAAAVAVSASAASADYSASAAFSAQQQAESAMAYASESLSATLSAYEAVAETGAIAIAVSSDSCEVEVCETWIETVGIQEITIETLEVQVVEITGELDACNEEVVVLDGEAAQCETELDVCEEELQSSSDAEDPACPPFAPTFETEMIQMQLSSSSPIPWTLPSQPMSFVVPQGHMVDTAWGAPGCCETFAVTIDCAPPVSPSSYPQ